MWKTIDTAPKDTYVLVYNKSGTMTVAGLPSGGPNKGRWQLRETGDGSEDDELLDTPTHWMELPEGPNEPGKQLKDIESVFVYRLRESMKNRSDDERIEIMNTLMDGYCTYCGSKHLPCYCKNDE